MDPDGTESPMFTGFQAQKKRPWTSLDEEVVGRGNLNWCCMQLK